MIGPFVNQYFSHLFDHIWFATSVIFAVALSITVHTNTKKHYIPESTFNYQKALRKIICKVMPIKPGITVSCAMANKIYTYVLRIDYTPNMDFYESLTTD